MRSVRIIAFGALGAALGGMAAPATAVSTIRTTLNLAYPGVVYPNSAIYGTPAAFTAIDPVTLGPGDTFDYTIDFGGRAVTMTSGFYVSALLSTSGTTSNVPTTNATLAFLDANDQVVASYSANNLFCCHWIGADQTVSLSSPLTFSAVRVTALLSGYDTQTYDAPLFSIGAYSHPFTISDSVPEPATWLAMLAGFGAIGGAMRGRKIRLSYSRER